MDGEQLWPAPWLGMWLAADDKSVVITTSPRGVRVTVAPRPTSPPYLSAELLEGGSKRIDRLPAVVGVDDQGQHYLEIEAGTADLGPTYRLYPAIRNESGGTRPAPGDTPVQDVILLPETSIGLYDDWDDDLGVPWAYPLAPFRWASSGGLTPR